MAVIVGVVILLLLAAAKGQEVPDDEKRDCYPWPDVSEETCIARGCRWNNEVDEGVPWCYIDDKVCPSTVAEGSRVECLPEGGGAHECTTKGCAWCETSTQDIPWCFNDPEVNQGGELCPAEIFESDRIDCHPDPGANAENCVRRGCYWCESATGAPSCFTPQERGYRMLGDPIPTSKGYQVQLERKNYPSTIGEDIERVNVDVEIQTDERLRVRITDAVNDRFAVPLDIDSPPTQADNPLYDIEFISSPSFAFKVTRKSSGAVVFDTTIGGLQMADQYLQFSTRLNSDNFYGFGEHEHHTLKHDMNWVTWPLWTRDHVVNTSFNLYGQHPVYLNVEQDGSAHMVLILNANAADVTLMPAPALTYRTIGGELDLYFFLGPSPGEAVQQYQQAVGTPVMVPYWALGFQLCRWGYRNLTDLQAAVGRMREYDIPHDVQYGDIDYMDGRKDFTIDPEGWGDLPEYVDQLKDEGTRFIIILDPAISSTEDPGTYPPLDNGNAMDIWVKNSSGEAIEGVVWPGRTFYPDYTNPTTEDWWTQECVDFKKEIDYAGLWIDMNEPSSFIHGQEGGCSSNKWNEPIFVPDISENLVHKTMCMDADQAMGRFYDVHSLYGWSMTKQTLTAARVVEENLKRGVVFSRSTFPGSGKWGQHWLGDNWSDWSNLRWSIIGIMEFNWFGYPYVGADICGFIGRSDEEMCQRWQQLGAFYPFSRNHNGLTFPDQDPGIWSEVARVTRETLMIRYTLLPFLYTLHHHAHMQGATVVRPLFFEFPSEAATLTITDQFLWGSSFLVSPVLDQNTTSITAYLPDARWFSYYDGAEVDVRASTVTLDAPLDFINLHVRGGHIMPTQQPARSTMFSRLLPMGLIVALDDNGQAGGDLFWDDGEALDTQESGTYLEVQYAVSDGSLTNTIVTNGYPGASELIMDDVRVFGAGPISSVLVNGAAHDSWEQNANTKDITIREINVGLTAGLDIQWS